MSTTAFAAWKQDKTGQWRYMTSDSTWLTSQVTPDGYKVDVNGVQLSADTLFRSFSIYENGSKVWLSLEKRNCLHVEEEAV